MTKRKTRLSDMEFDEVSTVDKGANQLSRIAIAKRAPEEEPMPEFYTEDGTLLTEDAELTDGQVIFDGEGNAYQWTLEEEKEEEKELATVGKSAFLDSEKTTDVSATTSFSKAFQEELAKAFSDEDRDKVISKAAERIDELEKRLEDSAQIAKSERDLRLTREYISKADTYNIPIDAQELGPVLYRMAETMSYEDCAVINKALEAAGTILFEEVGYQGGGDNDDVMSMVEQRAHEVIGKSADVSMTQAINKVFDDNPEAYDAYLASRQGY